MTKEELWKIYTEKNPQFGDAEARFTITGAGIQKLFEQTWEKAHEKGVANGRAMAEVRKKVDESFSPFSKWMGK